MNSEHICNLTVARMQKRKKKKKKVYIPGCGGFLRLQWAKYQIGGFYTPNTNALMSSLCLNILKYKQEEAEYIIHLYLNALNIKQGKEGREMIILKKQI